MELDNDHAGTEVVSSGEQIEQLQSFIRWLQANGVQLRGSEIKHSRDCFDGLGVFSKSGHTEGVVMVTPLHLAITPMRVLQDPDLGETYMKLFEDGDVDDRLLMFLFLMVERIRGPLSFWASYLDVLPTKFGTPLWFTEQELQELKGTSLYNASRIQLKNLKALFMDKVKPFAGQLLSIIGGLKREIEFQDFLWANCVFWTRALNIPCPYAFVFPEQLIRSESIDIPCERKEQTFLECSAISNEPIEGEGTEFHMPPHHESHQNIKGPDEVDLLESKDSGRYVCNQGGVKRTVRECNECTDAAKFVDSENRVSKHTKQETVWVEGLVPGIDFCNHDHKSVAHWEVDGDQACATGVPNSMYLTADVAIPADKEIFISYGNKGNEELLFLYGFVVEDNPDDYLMVHFPKEALERDVCADAKIQLLQEQMCSLRWLFPTALLKRGFYREERTTFLNKREPREEVAPCNYSWSGNRKLPTYQDQCVFPEETLAALRVVAMKENDLQLVMSMFQELQRSPSGEDVRAAVWEVCGNTGALQLLTDLLAARMLDLEEGSGSEDADKELLERDCQARLDSDCKERSLGSNHSLSENVRACVIYRKGQKYLATQFLKESEHLLELCILEEQCKAVNNRDSIAESSVLSQLNSNDLQGYSSN